jgi:glycolate oxidase FAD binding subunit
MLAAIVSREHLLDAPADAAVDGVQPRWIARPADVEQVSRVLALARAEGLAVIPRGSGAAAALGNPPARADLVLDLTRLHRVIEYEPADVVVSVEAGITLEELGRALGKQRQLLALDPPGWRGRTVGGVLAANASGPLRARYGTGRDLLLGVRFVQADGSVTWGGARVVKSVTGYDVPKLVVGSLGTIGVIVETTLRLHPAPEADRTWLATFTSLGAARDFLAALFDSTLQPGRVEILNERALEAVERPAAAVSVAVSFLSVEEAVRAQGEALSSVVHRAGGVARRSLDGFWDAYDAALARRSGPGVTLRIACLASSVTETIAATEAMARTQGLEARIAGCAATGTLCVSLEGEHPPDAWRSGVIDPLRERLAPEGGSVVVERAAPALKSAIDVWGPIAPQAFALMKRVKTEFDPTGVLNPGRFAGRL